MIKKLFYHLLFISLFNYPSFAQFQNHRLVVLSDIEADPDDSQSLIRLLLYANKIDIEALIATTSTHQRKKVVPESMHEIINAYGKVQSNLLKHEAGFPSADYLNSIVTKGLPVYGMAGVGKGYDSEGSEKIIEIINRKDDRPINGIDNTTISNSWLAENIQQNHGPLGAMYPDVAYGMEGDTPTQNQATGGVPIEQETRAIWTNAEDEYSPRVPNEFGQSIRKDSLVFKDNWVSLWRWRDDFQRDFTARMDWTFKTYEEANLAPVIQLAIPDAMTVHSGDKLDLDAKGTYDPDGDSMTYWWFPYLEAGTFKGKISFGGQAENLYNQHDFTIPEVEIPQTLHFILKVTDKGSPAMSSYKRVILNILPKN